MVVGTPTSMRDLAQQLLKASERGAATEVTPWPPVIAQPQVIGPYKDVRHFTLSFHLQGSAPLEKVVPHKRRALWLPLFFLLAIFSSVGAVTVWRWLTHAISN
jgi:hypothetical protein